MCPEVDARLLGNSHQKRVETTPSRRVLITGSTSGLGWELAQIFAREGHHIFLHGLDDAGPSMAKALSTLCDKNVGYSSANLSTEEGARQLIAEARASLGGIDVLVNNAGIQHVAPIGDFSTEKWQLVLNVNLSAPFYLAREVWAEMKERAWGRIINIASVHGLRASAFKVAYVSAKHALVGMTKALALEGAGFGITVNAICPGWIQTPLVANQVRAQAEVHGMSEAQVVQEVMLTRQPIKEFVSSEIIGQFAELLCRPASSAITGSAFVFDGGWTAQ